MEEDKINIRQTQKLMLVHISVGNSAKEHRHSGKDYEDLSRCLDICLLSDKGLQSSFRADQLNGTRASAKDSK